jgi:hypothetical protein
LYTHSSQLNYPSDSPCPKHQSGSSRVIGDQLGMENFFQPIDGKCCQDPRYGLLVLPMLLDVEIQAFQGRMYAQTDCFMCKTSRRSCKID